MNHRRAGQALDAIAGAPGVDAKDSADDGDTQTNMLDREVDIVLWAVILVNAQRGLPWQPLRDRPHRVER